MNSYLMVLLSFQTAEEENTFHTDHNLRFLLGDLSESFVQKDGGCDIHIGKAIGPLSSNCSVVA